MAKRDLAKEYKVHSLERGLDLIELLAQGSPEKSLSEVSKAAGFNQATAHRILSALKSRGYVRQNSSNSRYALTLKLFELGNQVIQHLNLHEEALPVLKQLADETGESVFLVILDGDEALCIENINAYRHVQVLFLRVGRRMPLHIGASPKVLLAHLPEERVHGIIERTGLAAWTPSSIADLRTLKADLKQIREQGYALGVNDVTDGAASLGSPIYNWKAEVVAAISVSGATSHFSEDKLPSLIKVVTGAAYEISRRLNAPLDTPDLQRLRASAKKIRKKKPAGRFGVSGVSSI
jgi:IclR family transcriptional regulator, KDG regulon repressor